MTVYEVVLEGNLRGNDLLTVLHYDVTGVLDGALLAGVFAGNMQPDFLARLVPDVGYTGITIREDIAGGVGVFYPFTSAPLVGTNADDEYWSQASATIRKLTDSGSRPAQGRIFQGGLPAGSVDGQGLLQQNVADDLVAFWEAMREWSLSNGAVGVMVIKASNPAAANTVAYNPVSEMASRLIPSTQRRRKLNEGS